MAVNHPPQPSRNPRELEARILQMLRDLYHPPQTEARAASELRFCAMQFNLNAVVQPYPPGQSRELQTQHFSLQGNLPFIYNGTTWGIPIQVFALPYFPDMPPVVVVVPPQGLVVPRGHPCVRHDGLIMLRELDRVIWQSKRLNLYAVLIHLQHEFANLPPLAHDPLLAERQTLLSHLHLQVLQTLQAHTRSAQDELVHIHSRTHHLRDAEVCDDPHAENAPPERKLRHIRQQRLLLDRQIDLYAMRDGDVSVDQFVACDKDERQLEKYRLRAHDKALSDALEVVSRSLDRNPPESELRDVAVEVFIRQTMELASAQYKVRDQLRSVELSQTNIAQPANIAQATSIVQPTDTAQPTLRANQEATSHRQPTPAV